MIEPMLPTENAEWIEAIEPSDPIDRIEPAEPMDKIEPADPMDKIEPAEPMLRIEPAEPGDDSRCCCVRTASIFLPSAIDQEMNFSSAELTWSACVQEMACGPSSMTSNCRLLIIPGSRCPVLG
jgi:hypothetical protein